MSIASQTDRGLPSAMERKLRAIRSRQVALATVRACAIGIAALLLCMLVAMIIDWSFVLFSMNARVFLSGVSLTLATCALLVLGLPPLMEMARSTRAARSADEVIPQLEERWTTVASIAASNHQPSNSTARAMLRQVTSEAVAMNRLVKPSTVAQPAIVRPSLLVLAGCAAAFVGFMAIDWSQTSVLLRRFWAPTQNITATQLACVTGDATIPRGESVELATRLSGVPRDAAVLEIVSGEEIIDTFTLAPDSKRSNLFAHRVAVENSFRYRVHSGDTRTDWNVITVIDYPELDEVRFVVTPPKYIDRPPYDKTLIPARVKAIQGSRLRLEVKPVAALQRCELELTVPPRDDATEPDREIVVLEAAEDGWYRFETQLLEDFSFRPLLENEHGLTNEDRRICRVQVIPDKAPVARILNSEEEASVANDETIDIRFEAHDDHGITSAELVVYDETDTPEGEEPKILSIQPIPLEDAKHRKHVSGKVQLDLSKLDLPEGTRISYAIRVTDNRMLDLDEKGEALELAEADPDRDANDRRTGKSPRDGDRSNDTNTRNTSGAQPESEKSAKDMADMLADAGDAARDSDKGKNSLREPGDANNILGDESNPSLAEEPTLADVTDDQNTDERADGTNTAEGQPSKPGVPNDGKSDGGPTNTEQVAKAGNRTGSARNRNGTQSANNGNPNNNSKRPNEARNNSDTNTRIASRSENDGKPRRAQMPTDGANVPRPRLALRPQMSSSGQNATTGRRRLRITERLAAVAEATFLEGDIKETRSRVIRINEMLKTAEEALTTIVDRDIPDADRSDRFADVDEQLGKIEAYVADLREDTRDGEFAFVGLQMVHITRTQVTPARDRVFAGIREPLGTENPSVALHHVLRAREMLETLLKRYDRVARDRKLAERLQDSVTMYEIYIEKSRRLMSAARQNRNPLQRKMAVIKVDQEYLDRYAEVLTLRRELMAELGRMLSDDPRLLARYLDITRRRRKSLRDRLTEVAERQDEIALELQGWLQVDESQRDDVWSIVTQMRTQMATPMAKDASELAERIEQSLPLILKPDEGTAAVVIKLGHEIAQLSRRISLSAKKFGEDADIDAGQRATADELVFLLGELDAALERLNFENEDAEEVDTYVSGRVLENRTIADTADEWSQLVRNLLDQRYTGLAEIDEQKLGIETELLRIDMLAIEDQLEAQFQQQAEADVPGEIIDLVRQLHRVMEAVVMNQSSATFALSTNQMEPANAQLARAVESLTTAQELFDAIRRGVAAALDEYDPRNPNIADLRDPTLDQFLANLEREPNIQAQLGIPNRRRNLRVIAQALPWARNGSGGLGQSGEAAMARANKESRRKADGLPRTMSEEERQRLAQAEDMQEMLEESQQKIQERIDDPKTSDEQREQLQRMLKNMQRMRQNMNNDDPTRAAWQELVEGDQAAGALKALARGENIADNQWNKLLSTLDDGLWQVRGRTPPEDYRKAIEQYQDQIRQLMDNEGNL